jgi:hypothetical protein
MKFKVSLIISLKNVSLYKEWWSKYICCIYCHVYEWLYARFGLGIAFIEILQNVTTSNYSATANSHTLQVIRAHTKPSRPAVSSSPLLAKVKVKVILRLTISQSVSLGIEHPPGAHDQIFFFLLLSCSIGGALSDERSGLSWRLVFLITPRHEPHRKYRFQRFLYCCVT